jgi:hypothetical protein
MSFLYSSEPAKVISLMDFSAFIQSARSVTWTLGNEEKKKWEAWEPKWRATRSNEEQKLLDLTNDLRLDEAKRGLISPPASTYSRNR